MTRGFLASSSTMSASSADGDQRTALQQGFDAFA